MLRRSLALVLLCAHAAAAVHLALGAHAVDSSGAVVEAQPECVQPHGADGISHGHELAVEDGECEAFALLRAVARTGSVVSAGPIVVPEAAVLAVVEARATPPLCALSVAPKGSPPV